MPGSRGYSTQISSTFANSNSLNFLKLHDNLNAFARSDGLDMGEAFQIKEMPVSENDQCDSVFRGKREEKVVEGVCIDDGGDGFRIRYKGDKIVEIFHGFLWTNLQHGKPVREFAVEKNLFELIRRFITC